MYQIRFHGRGGQGMKTASHILGTAFFLEGYNVQDAPRYGAERRGAPIFAYVRASHETINDRGIILHPDLVIVADDSLAMIPTAGVSVGLDAHTVLLMVSRHSAEYWQSYLDIKNKIIILSPFVEKADSALRPEIGAVCAAAAACLSGEISRSTLEKALREELSDLKQESLIKNLDLSLNAYDSMNGNKGIVISKKDRPLDEYTPVDWIDVPFDQASISAPSIHAPLTSLLANTGTWRTMKPIIDYDKCNGCHWVCSTYCPDSCISVDVQGLPQIDYDECKGCMICVVQCPPNAIDAVAETDEPIKKNTQTKGVSP